MTIEYTLHNLTKTAQLLIQNFHHKIILFDAEMGVGKTTLIREICKQMGVRDSISSPTYSLVNEYESNDGLIYHFDFYRIENEEEAHQIGFEEYLDSNSWVFIEWPGKIEELLPKNVQKIKITLEKDSKRLLNFS